MNIRYPNITAASPMEQLEQIRGYLFQLVEQLNMEEDAPHGAEQRFHCGRDG